jgi:hypothetical protein
LSFNTQNFCRDPIKDPIERLLEFTDWGNIPKLAKKLGINPESVHGHCIEALTPMLSKMTSVHKFVIARQFAAEDWFCSAISELVTRDATLSAIEAKQLRLEATFCIQRLREDWETLINNDLINHIHMLTTEHFPWSRHHKLYCNRHAPPPTPKIPSERFDQLHLAICHCFSFELAEMGFVVDKTNKPTLFQRCLDGDECLLQVAEKSPFSVGTEQSPSKLTIRHSTHYHEAIIFQVSYRNISACGCGSN